MTRFAHVALPLPLASTYSYRIPEPLLDRVEPGARLVVPVRRREMIGIAVAVDDAAPGVSARDVLGAPDAEPALPTALLETAEWLAGYYGAPLGLTLKCILPAGMWGESHVVMTLTGASSDPGGDSAPAKLLRWLEDHGGTAPVRTATRALGRSLWDAVARLERLGAIGLTVVPPDTDAARRTERVLTLPAERLTLVEREEVFHRRPRQRELYEVLESLGGSAPMRHLRDRLGFSDSVLRAVIHDELAIESAAEHLRDPFAGTPATPPPTTLTDAQIAAVRRIGELPAGGTALLYGVTGSGKTLVYLEAVRRELALGRGAIVLVPEIGLTPQTVSRFRGAFGDEIAVLHSGLSEGERADAWRLLRRGERRVAVGARSAIFAPVRDLGLIVIDEEHEASYKNGETPRYHARDVALVRARLEGARVVLGSATPSLETMSQGEGTVVIRLPDRIGARPMPPVELVDLRSAPKVEGLGALPWSQALDGALTAVLARKEQALLLLNRRGFASFLQCPDCGEVWDCPRCSISLTVHQTPRGLRCHYCDHQEPLPYTCRKCANPVQTMRGIGTQQLERLVAERFPTARIARMDLDTTSTKWAHQRILGTVERGEVDILLGTQMIAKGLDFPNVTLVGVVDADVGLHLPDFRSAERTFQLLAQVAGRAGRGPKGGKVLVQTRNPEHHALRHAAGHDTDGFVAEELALRRSPPYPPTVSLVNVVVSGPDEQRIAGEAASLADWCIALLAKHELPLMLLGPAPCPLARIKDRWRWHLLLKGPSRDIGRVVRYAARTLRQRHDVRITIDRDPVSVL